MQNAICIDWLQCHVKLPCRDFQNLFNPLKCDFDALGRAISVHKVERAEFKELDNRYLLEKTGIQTRNFKAIYEIKDKPSGEIIAVLAAEPRSLMCMAEDSGLIKIINKYLYQKNFLHFVQSLFKDLQLQFINITRLDLAYDFLKFDTMECSTFIEMFANQFYMKKTASKFKMMGDSWSVDKGKKTGGISSLKFGLETSDVNYYLYNKTLELQQVKHKPWIHDHWKSNGWNGADNVWRLEFSLHPDTKGIAVVNEDGELEHIYHFKDLTMLDNIDQVFEHYFCKHFQFVETEITKKGNYKKQSRCTPVVLFEKMKFEGVKIDLSTKKDSGRAAKTFAKKMMEFNNEMRGIDFDLAIMGNEMFTWVIQRYDLDQWRQKKLPGSHLSERVCDIVRKGKQANFEVNVLNHYQQRDQPKNVFKTRQEQALALQQAEYNLRVSKFQLIPDGMILQYDNCGDVVGMVAAPF